MQFFDETYFLIITIVKSSWSYFNDQYRVWVYQMVIFAQDETKKGAGWLKSHLDRIEPALSFMTAREVGQIFSASLNLQGGCSARLIKYESCTKLYRKYKCHITVAKESSLLPLLWSNLFENSEIQFQDMVIKVHSTVQILVISDRKRLQVHFA